MCELKWEVQGDQQEPRAQPWWGGGAVSPADTIPGRLQRQHKPRNAAMFYEALLSCAVIRVMTTVWSERETTWGSGVIVHKIVCRCDHHPEDAPVFRASHSEVTNP